MCVAAQQDFDIGKLEAQLLHRFLNYRHISFIFAVDEDVSLRRDDEKRSQAHRTHVIDIADDFMWRKLRALILRRANVALKKLLLGISVSAHADLRPRSLCRIGGSLSIKGRNQNGCRREGALEHS